VKSGKVESGKWKVESEKKKYTTQRLNASTIKRFNGFSQYSILNT